VPIRPFLEGQIFEQEHIDAMSKALADACQELGLKDKEDAIVRLLAKRIIDCAREGIHDPALLRAAATRASWIGAQAVEVPGERRLPDHPLKSRNGPG
jgi:hypothetical protein